MSVTDWVAGKLAEDRELKVVERTSEDFLVVSVNGSDPSVVAVLGVKNVIDLSHVQPSSLALPSRSSL